MNIRCTPFQALVPAAYSMLGMLYNAYAANLEFNSVAFCLIKP